jgi:glyoxylase-like metal-dependent hydrolase (beta-lactamase superfamily II)
MRTTALLAAAITLALSTAAHAANDVKKELEQARDALGGESLKSLQISGSGYDYAIGQAPNGNAPWPKFIDKTFARTVSFDPPASKLERTRLQGENPPHGGGGQPVIGEQKQTQVVAPGTPPAAALTDEFSALIPQAFIKAASAASDAKLTHERINGKQYDVVAFTASNRAITRGWINTAHLIERIETKVDVPVLGDTLVETALSDYRDFNGLKFPGHIVQKQGGYPVLDLTVTDVKADAITEYTAQPAPASATVSSEQLSDGIYLISGGYAAIAVGFKDHITILEGGQSEQRSDAVIAEAKRLFPGKPVAELVNTHPHFDHAGGLRAYVAEGARIITHKSNKDYLANIWSNPHTIAPDKLAKNPQQPKFTTVDEKLTLTDGEKVIELFHLTNFSHHDGMLVAYLPASKILFEADGFNPPAAPVIEKPTVVNLFSEELYDNVQRLGLSVERIVPVHLPADGRKVVWAELEHAAGK